MTTIAYRVARGATLLDQERPGWYKEIDLDLLDMEGGDVCVLAQLFGEGPGDHEAYVRGAAALFGSEVGHQHADSAAHGFITKADESYTVYGDLTEAWKRVIRATRNADDPLADWERELLDGNAETVAALATGDADVKPTVSLTHDDLVNLVTRAMDAAPTRGAYSEIGLVVTFLAER